MELESQVAQLQEDVKVFIKQCNLTNAMYITYLPLSPNLKQLAGNIERKGINVKIEGILVSPPVVSLSGHRGPITAVDFHPLFNIVATASDDAHIKIYDYEGGELERTFKGHTGSVNDITFNPSGTLLASASTDLSIKLWSMESYECTKTLMGHEHT
jgi:WD40 repeat protein